jgi:hypothetical protein
MYVKVNALEEKKARLEEELRDAMENLQEIEGQTDPLYLVFTDRLVVT